MGTFSSIVNTIVSNRRTRKTIRNIEMGNELRRGITSYEASDIEAFIERDREVGNYLISGGISYNRSRSATSIVTCALDQGIPVIVLHEGNTEMENYMRQVPFFANQKIFISPQAAFYDPFYNRTDQEICDIVLRSANENREIKSNGQYYISGIAEFIRSKNIPTYCEMFLRTPFNDLFEKLDEAVSLNYLSSQRATQIRNLLMQGQSEQSSIQVFFSQLDREGGGILSTKSTRANAVNIRDAVTRGSMIMIDIGSRSNELLLNVVISEIYDVLASGKSIALILDEISIDANKELAKLVRSGSTKCRLSLVAEDVYSMLGSDDNLFHSLVGRSSKCVVFSHFDGTSCTKWADVFGQYEVDKISHNVTTHQNFQFGYGSGNQNAINVSQSREYRIKPEEIAGMGPRDIFILDQVAHEIAYTTMR